MFCKLLLPKKWIREIVLKFLLQGTETLSMYFMGFTKQDSLFKPVGGFKTSGTLLWCCSSYKVVLTFESVGEILNCDHSNESY